MNDKKSLEPLWWGLFSAGGVVAAFLVPVHIVIVGIAVPMGWLPISPETFQNGLIRIFLFVLIALPFYHCAHRFYFTMNDIGLRPLAKPLMVLSYGGAVAGTAITAWVLWRI